MVTTNSAKFTSALERGTRAETILDRFFSQRYTITPATHDEQVKGFDRHFGILRPSGQNDTFTVEYKLDQKAEQTGNFFPELWHTNIDGVHWGGWAFKSQADFLALYVPGDESLEFGACYWVAMPVFRSRLQDWAKKYRLVTTPADAGKGKYGTPFTTIAPLVPLNELRRAATNVYAVGQQR